MRISDWSSDVCSSDLDRTALAQVRPQHLGPFVARFVVDRGIAVSGQIDQKAQPRAVLDRVRDAEQVDQSRAAGRFAGKGRSEERRVGKAGVRQCRSRWSPYN